MQQIVLPYWMSILAQHKSIHMKNERFGLASARLLEALGISPKDPLSIENLAGLRRELQTSIYIIEKLDIIKGAIIYNGSAKGGILCGSNAEPLAFINNEHGILKTIENNLTLNVEQLKKYSHAYILKEKKGLFGEISPFFRHYSGRLWDIIAAAFLINLFALTFPLFSSFVYDKVMGNGIYETLWALAICLLFVLGIEFFMRLIRLQAAERFAVSTETDIDYGIFKKLLAADMNSLPGVGVLLEKYKQIISYRDFLSSSYLVALADVPFVFLFLLSILIIAGPMVALVIIFGGALSLTSSLLLKPVLEHEAVAKVGSERRFGLLNDLLSSREVIIGSAFQGDIQDKLRQSSVESAIASSNARYWRGIGMSLANSLSYLSYVSVLVAGVYMVEAHKLTTGGLLAVSMLSSRAMSGMSSVSSLILRYKEFKSALQGLNSMLPDKLEKNIIPHGKLSGALHFENVTCRLRSHDNPVLDKINLNIQAGEIVGIAGAPGSGKTTLLRLMAGVIPADKGRILIDDIPIENLSPDDVSLSLGYKPQELCLLEGRIEENVRAGRSPLDAGSRKDVLRLSGLEFSFRESGLNWQSEVGVRGGKLSGGQRQLVSLARAFAYNPSLILLDEPTNGLDAALETHLAEQIKSLKGKATVIVSTHSHHILSICDRIIVVGQTKILADGPRERILQKN